MEADSVRDLWVEVVRSAERRGKIDTIPTTIARTTREKDQRRNQSLALTRRVYGKFHDNWDKIQWTKP